MRYSRWWSFQHLVERVKAWFTGLRAQRPFLIPLDVNVPAYPSSASISRDVTPNGVYVYSLCAGCGARLHASATLCDECAQKKSRPLRPY